MHLMGKQNRGRGEEKGENTRVGRRNNTYKKGIGEKMMKDTFEGKLDRKKKKHRKKETEQ